MNKAKFLTPVITAFDENGKIDAVGNKNIWKHLIAGGIDGIVLMGSTGEFFSMSMEERKQLIDLATEYTKGKIKLYVGTGCMNIEDTIELSNYALKKGADAVMIVGPYYFSLSPESIERYFDKVADSVNGEIYLYNFPDRTGYDLTADITLNLLRKHKNITGFKDTVNELGHTRKLITTVREEFPDFIVYSGYDENLTHVILSGGNGCIGGLSNLYPEIFSEWVKAINEGKLEKLEKIQKLVDRMMNLYEIGTPFIPIVKKAMRLRGIEFVEKSVEPFINSNDQQTEKLEELICSIENEKKLIFK